MLQVPPMLHPAVIALLLAAEVAAHSEPAERSLSVGIFFVALPF